jgi:hypothetical protein
MSWTLPFLEVSNLAASSSFYSTVTHPLGLRYISAASPSPDLPGSPSIVYGIATSPPVPIFELRQVRPTVDRPLKLSRIVFSAVSPAAVRDFRALVQRIKAVDTGAVGFGDHPQLEERAFGAELVQQSDGSPACTQTDLDGNIIKMEVVYVPPAQDYPEWYTGPTVRKTQSTESEASRILSWNYDVAADSAASMSFPPLTPSPQSPVLHREPDCYEERPSLLRRSVTTTTTLLEPADPESSSQSLSQSPRGLSAVGAALMGVAAGAALGAGITYSVVRSSGSQGFEAPMAQRRSTFPRQYSDPRGQRGDGASVADRRPPPTLLTRHSYSQAPTAVNRDAGGALDDGRSRHSSRSRPAGAPSVRTRSELSTDRKPLLLTDVASRSHAGSRSSARTAEMEDALPPGNPRPTSSRYSTASRTSKHPPSIRRSSTYDGPVVDHYSCVSAGSYRTQSTVRPAPAPAPQPERVPRVASKAPSKAPSKVPSRAGGPSNSRVSAVTAWPSGRAESYVSARHVPLPPSGVGSSSHMDDDLESLAPSDSISCVGSRRSERLHP